MRRLFALDNNFPEPIVKALAEYIDCAELVSVRQIDKAFAEIEDWELLLELGKHDRDWDGLITTDDSMLSIDKVLSALLHTRLTVVVARGQGHNPIRATGVLFAHIEHICHQTQRDTAQVWNLKVSQKPHVDPWALLEKIAEKRGTTATALYQAHKVAGLLK